MKIALIQDKYNENKIWIIKKYKNRNIFYNQKIGDRVIYNFSRTSKKFLKSLFETFSWVMALPLLPVIYGLKDMFEVC